MAFTTTVALNAQDPYVVVHYDLGSAKEILFADAVGLRRTTAGNTFTDFRIQYSTDNVTFVDFGAAFEPFTNTGGNTRRRTGPVTARYWRVAKTGANNYGGALFTLEAFSLWQSTADLSDARIVDHFFSHEQGYALLFTDRNARVYKDGVYQADIRTSFESEDLPLLNWTQSLDTLIATQPEVAPMRIQRQGSDTEWLSESLPFDYIPKYAFELVVTKPATTLTPSATEGVVTLTAGAATFTAAHEDQFIWGNYGGARITEYVSTTVVKAIVVVPFLDTTAIASQAWTLETGYEDVWSSTRGWPETCIFYQNRLVLAGGGELPNAVGISKVAEYYNFDPAQALDDDAIFMILQANDVPAVHGLRADRHLQIFTTNAEYYLEQGATSVLTPRNAAFRRTTARGIKRGLRPLNATGATIFLQRGGASFRDFVFTDSEASYVAGDLSLFWAHLVDDPVDMAMRASQVQIEVDTLFAVNTDGTMAVCNQQGRAGVLWTTDGLYKRIGVLDGEVYAVVERTINGAAARYFEIFDPDLYVDCGVEYSGAFATLTGLSHLNGETVKVRADSFWQADQVVAAGEITPADAVVATAQVGLEYTPLVETLAPWKNSQGGPIVLDGMTRIARVAASVQATQNLLVQGDFVDFRSFDSNIDDPIPEFTGTKIIDGLLGWQRDNKVVLTQNAPAPLTLRGIEYLVET